MYQVGGGVITTCLDSRYVFKHMSYIYKFNVRMK